MFDTLVKDRKSDDNSFVENGIRYEQGGIRNDTVRMCGFVDNFQRPVTLVIPAEVRGKHVIFVNPNAFKGEPIEEIIIENRNGWSFAILDSAFAHCTKLHAIKLNTDTMIDFEKNAFIGCEKLVKVDGENVEVRVYSNAFKDCVSLEHFQPAIVTLWREAFHNCPKLHRLSFSKSYAFLYDGCLNYSAVKQISVGKIDFDEYALSQIPTLGITVSCSDENTVTKLKEAGVNCCEN